MKQRLSVEDRSPDSRLHLDLNLPGDWLQWSSEFAPAKPLFRD